MVAMVPFGSLQVLDWIDRSELVNNVPNRQEKILPYSTHAVNTVKIRGSSQSKLTFAKSGHRHAFARSLAEHLPHISHMGCKPLFQFDAKPWLLWKKLYHSLGQIPQAPNTGFPRRFVKKNSHPPAMLSAGLHSLHHVSLIWLLARERQWKTCWQLNVCPLTIKSSKILCRRSFLVWGSRGARFCGCPLRLSPRRCLTAILDPVGRSISIACLTESSELFSEMGAGGAKPGEVSAQDCPSLRGPITQIY